LLTYIAMEKPDNIIIKAMERVVSNSEPYYVPTDHNETDIILSVSGLSYIKDNVSILNDISFDLRKGEFFSIFGQSGCGKSTLLKLIAGFEQPTSGSIILNGKDITNLPPEERNLNLIFQSYALFPHMNVEENVQFGLKNERLSREVIQERTSDILQRLRMEKYRYQPVMSLSGGEKQRVAIARALVKQPLVLLLDEPFSALDKSLQESTQLEMVDLQESLGMTFLMVTHDQEEAMTVSSRIGFLDKGEILQIAPPHELYEAPNSLQVAQFVGEMNVMSGVVRSQSNGTACVYCNDIEAEVLTVENHLISPGAEVYIAIRPEKVQISHNPNGILGKVHDLAYLGDMSIYHVKLSSGKIIKSSVLNAKRVRNIEFTWDQDVYIAWDPMDAFLLKD